LQDWFASTQLFYRLSHYRVILPLIGVSLLISFIILKRTKYPLQRTTIYLNLLMLLFVFFELIGLTKNAWLHRSDKNEQNTETTATSAIEAPDIYYLLLDGYAGHSSLLSFAKFDNSSFEDSLRSMGFNIAKQAHSNYNFTPFSLASTLNMRFIKGIADLDNCTPEDYLKRAEEIRENKVTNYLSKRGYEIVNNSVFDLEGQPSPVSETFLPLKGRLLTDQTLVSRARRDLLHLLLVGRFAVSWLRIDPYTTLRNNEKLIASTKDVAAQQTTKPKFVYTHLYMPHPPYYYDELGKLRPGTEVEKMPSPAGELTLYINNLRVTNVVVLQMINTILKNSKHPPVILITGDHGFRPAEGVNDPRIFNTLAAVFVQGSKSPPFYDSISNVNHFPVLFNRLFRDSIPVQKDSIVFLQDQK
ncbi:MAG: hypothetical protein EOO01_30050, partial [Chitinophagaceae bacterium]